MVQIVIRKVNIAQKFSKIQSLWTPGIAGELNDQYVKLVKFKGKFVWHTHENEDELFMVIKGSFKMHLPDKTISMSEGEFLIIPRGVKHCPEAEEEVHVLLFEPKSTINTGDVESDMTRSELDKV